LHEPAAGSFWSLYLFHNVESRAPHEGHIDRGMILSGSMSILLDGNVKRLV
jgi:hypothetical protein